MERLLPWKVMRLVCLRDDGIIREEWSSGDRMADQGRSLVPPAGPQTDILQVININIYEKVGWSSLATRTELHSIVFVYKCILLKLPEYITTLLKFIRHM